MCAKVVEYWVDLYQCFGSFACNPVSCLRNVGANRLSFEEYYDSRRVVMLATTIEKLSLTKFCLLICVVYNDSQHTTEMELGG